MDISKIKLVIWDLDDTFWKGTLSERDVEPVIDNIKLISDLTDRGIVNTICSKNDFLSANTELEKECCADLFVFKSIDYTPKGQRITNLIQNMGLQAKHCLFIDDNPANLNEAKYYSPDLNVSDPIIIESLFKYVKQSPISDKEHKRLNSYKILEQKQQAKALVADNLKFLYDCDIQVEIRYDCMNEIDRIYEMVNRTNQLNYTKKRCSKEDLVKLCNQESVDVGYIKLKDRFGDYGIVGFYAKEDNKLIHFLFSCRVIGQGVEQYVYSSIGCPELVIVGDVVNDVLRQPCPDWINQNKGCSIRNVNVHKNYNRIIFKGPCDLKSMTSYLNTDYVLEEFTYIGDKKHNHIEFINHSTNYLSFPFLSQSQRQALLDDCVFSDEQMYKTAMYDEDVALIFLSTLIEPNLGVYRNKKNGIEIAFGEYCYPLTNPIYWDLYINKMIYVGDNDFTLEWLTNFTEKYEFIGNLSPIQIIENAKKVLSLVNPNAKVCYMLGSETPYYKNSQQNYNGRENIYREINQLFRELAQKDNRVLLIDFNDFIKGQEDFTNNINHFVRRVYYEAALQANEYIVLCTGKRLVQKSLFYMKIKTMIDNIGKTGFYQTPLWHWIRKPYVFLKGFINK